MNAKEFVAQIVEGNQALFKASQINVKAYFDSKPAQEELVEHFIGRMVNERMNMVEISNAIAQMPADADPVELQLLSQQAHDEAVHFRLVKEVIEHIQGSPVDVEAAIAREASQNTAKGAALLEKYEADTNPLALALYQFIAEGRAERNWDMMSRCVDDEFISSRYAKIARDEGFHSKIGRYKLEQLCNDAEAQAAVEAMADQMRRDLFEISCQNSIATAEAKEIFEAAYH